MRDPAFGVETAEAEDPFAMHRRIEQPQTPNYHFTTDMTNQAINWVSAQKSLTPDKPFYMYFATGATHATLRRWFGRRHGR